MFAKISFVEAVIKIRDPNQSKLAGVNYVIVSFGLIYYHEILCRDPGTEYCMKGKIMIRIEYKQSCTASDTPK